MKGATLCEVCWESIFEPSPLPHPPEILGALALGRYHGPLRTLLTRSKFLADPLPLPIFREMITTALPQITSFGTNLVTHIPYDPLRLKKRGFDFPFFLGQSTAKALHLSHIPQSLQRTRSAAAQHELPKNERLKNLRGAFVAQPHVKGKDILLVDDIATTGATLHEAGHTLLAGGARTVSFLTLAHTPDFW